MKLPSFKRIFKQDFEEQYATLIDSLSFFINNGVEVLYEALNQNVSLQDNIKCTVKTITVIVDSNGIPQGNATFILNTADRLLGVVVLRSNNLSNSNNLPIATPFLTYTQTQTGVTINNIKGLQASDKYELLIVAFA